MKRILVIDGGGAKGLIPAVVVESIEDELRKPIHAVFDLIIGTSIGSHIGGVLASGKVSASTFRKTLYNELPNIFKWRFRWPFFQPKYDHKYIKKILEAYLNEMILEDCKTKFLCTSVNMCDARTHFFKSWEKKDGKLLIVDALLRSSAAPLYFGSIKDSITKSIWLDGGCGNMNSPVMQALTEALLQGWLDNDHVHVLSLGCGQRNYSMPFDIAEKCRNIRQIWFYGDVVEGGLARIQDLQTHSFWAQEFSKKNPKLTFQRLEKYNIPKKIDKMDGSKYRDDYIAIGKELSVQVDYTHLR